MTSQKLEKLQEESKERHANQKPYIWPWTVEKVVVKVKRKPYKKWEPVYDDPFLTKQAAAKAIADKINKKVSQ